MPYIFHRITPDSPYAPAFAALMLGYGPEISAHTERPLTDEMLRGWTQSILRLSASPDRLVEVCFDGDVPVGFLYGKIDREGDRGYIRPNWGYIMEFYVIPERRREGLGRIMAQRLEDFFREKGVKQAYLTADPVTGKPFWAAAGYWATGEVSPENGQEFFEKKL